MVFDAASLPSLTPTTSTDQGTVACLLAALPYTILLGNLPTAEAAVPSLVCVSQIASFGVAVATLSSADRMPAHLLDQLYIVLGKPAR